MRFRLFQPRVSLVRSFTKKKMSNNIGDRNDTLLLFDIDGTLTESMRVSVLPLDFGELILHKTAH